MEIGADGRHRYTELEVLAREVISQLRANRIEMRMLTRHHVRLEPLPQDPKLALERPPVTKLQQA
ncbi:MAG TPA: hypothetical protein VK993_05555 [Chthoniobacterales bacterium]|nr:hypothetical protein [Chthoniobacterales bacterium]